MAAMNASARGRMARAGAACVAGLGVALLAACGGGGGGVIGGPALAQAQFASAGDAVVAERSGLRADPAQVLSASSTQVHSVLAVGALDGGGHAVAWLARPAADAQAEGEVFVQRFGVDGAALGSPLPLPQRFGPDNLAVHVHADGSVSVATAVASSPDTQTRRTDLRLHRFDAAGQPLGTSEVASVQHQTWDRAYRSLLNPAFAAWPDGRYALAWAAQVSTPLGTAVEVSVQAFDAIGQAQGGPVSDREAEYASFRVSTVPDGGFVLGTLRRGVQPYQVFTQVGLALPLPLPRATELDPSVPQEAMLLSLHLGGHVFFTGRPGAAGTVESPQAQWFGADGLPGGSTPLAALPQGALALADGGFLTLSGGSAQRYTEQAQAVGDAVTLASGEAVPAQALRGDGGVALAWNTRGEDGVSRVVMQRVRVVE